MGQLVDLLGGADGLEHEGETVLRPHVDRHPTRLPRGIEGLSEGHEPACWSASKRCDQGPMTLQLEQVIAAGANTGDPLCDQLPADRDRDLLEPSDLAKPATRCADHRKALEHDTHTGLFAGEGIVGKDALTRLADLTASQPDPQPKYKGRLPEPSWDPAGR